MGSESRKKTEMLPVRATPEEKAALRKRAAAFGISVGALVRAILFGAIPKSKTDQTAIAELAVMRADLGRLGGLLKGWLSGAFPAAPLPQHDQVRALLHDIEAAQKKVLAAVNTLVGTA
jgi:plasmid stability protein